MQNSYIDIHSHLNDARFDADLPETLARMREANVTTIVVGTDSAMSKKAVVVAEAHNLWATIGLHPTDNHKEPFDSSFYEELAANPCVVAIGECGLDYHWPAHDGWKIGEKEEKARQRDIFERQIAVAEKTGKPLMIHGRPTTGSMDAYEDILEVLKNSPDIRGDVHFFAGNTHIAKRFLDIGFSMSVTGVITFTHDYDEVIKYIPLDRLMAETDAPYVAPVPYRGHRCEPTYVTEVYKTIAHIRGVGVETLCDAFSKNAHAMFGL